QMCRWKRWGASIRAVQVLTSRCLRRSSVFSVTLLFALCGSGSSAATQGVVKLPVVEKTDLRFTHLASGEGQPHSRVGQIVQDDLGFLWFGTQDGLQRYDGYRSF